MKLKPFSVPLLATLCLTTALAHAARAQSAIPLQPAEPRRTWEETDAATAQELYDRGRTLMETGETQRALEPLGEAVRIYTRLYVGGRTPTPTQASYRSRMAGLLAHAPEAIELFTRLGGVAGASEFERAQLEALRGQVEGIVATDPARAVFLGNEVDTRIVITAKPEPGFTEEARRKNVNGTVRLRAVLTADGEVRDVLVLAGLPEGMSEKCIEAAVRMKFTPARKDGRPVSQFVVLEYNFNVY